MTIATPTKPLTGDDLLAFIKANQDSKTKAELAQESGYDINGFWEAVMEAKGIDTTITPNPYEGRDVKDLLLEKGFTQLQVSYDPNLNGFVSLDGNGDSLEDEDLQEHLQEELWELLTEAVGNNVFRGVVNVGQQGLTFTGEVLQPVSHTDLSLG